jgi:hypothetical protein
MEGVDGEEVGWTDDMWEGMGSVTLAAAAASRTSGAAVSTREKCLN